MTADLPFNDATVRLAVFLGVLLTMATLEALLPRRKRMLPRLSRWGTNAAIIGLSALLIRALVFVTTYLAVPLVAVTAAIFAQQRGIGLFNWLAWPPGLELLLAIVVLDFAIWFQHVASHLLPVIWRLHQVHHADRDFDVTTALRFHPVEIGLSMLYKVIWVIALGASPLAVIVFEIILNALAMFNHANVALPLWLDRILRLGIVTPDMHRVHHSVHSREHNANFGFNLSIWDRLFGTYIAQPQDGHEAMTIGLPQYQTGQPQQLGWSLLVPFQRKPVVRPKTAPKAE
jgi:sterol desaturase/sphingolipid hydroxylase (fatty acid hydroxylase superfamily)